MKRNKLKEFFGFKYVYNLNTNQIHKVKNLKSGCKFDSIKSGIYCTYKKAIKLITKGDEYGKRYDGCIHC